MTYYPMELQRISYDHKGGTKSYELTIVANAKNQCLIIRHWGKTGKLNAQACERFDNVEAAEKRLVALMKERDMKGYSAVDQKTLTVEDATKLPIRIGRGLFPKLGAQNVNHIDMDYDTAGFREPPPNTTDDDGNYLGAPPTKKVDFEAQMRAEREQAISSHPLYGRF